jgi:hypothetical protein
MMPHGLASCIPIDARRLAEYIWLFRAALCQARFTTISAPQLRGISSPSEQPLYTRSPAMERITDNILRPLNIVFAGLGLGLSAAIIATEAHVYHTFKTQSAANNPFWIPIWPQHFETAGTKTAIGIVTAILVLHLAYIAVYLRQSVS